jgi:hypothetical protein
MILLINFNILVAFSLNIMFQTLSKGSLTIYRGAAINPEFFLLPLTGVPDP